VCWVSCPGARPYSFLLTAACCCVLQTFKNGTSITVESNNGGTIKLSGAGTSADITRKDLYACKVGTRAHPGS
jgi:hypothetical protein